MSQPLRLADWYPDHAEEIATTLRDWLDIASVASIPELRGNVAAAAEFAVRLMRDSGLRQCTVLDTASAPAAYAEWTGAGDAAPTVLVIGHLDVLPAAPIEEWSSPPFEAQVTGDAVTGRGAAAGKGAVLAAIESFRGLLESGSAPRVNLKFLIHGEATIASPGLASLLATEAHRLDTDIVVVPVAGAGNGDQGTVLAGTRGLLLVGIEVRTADHDAATANYGGAIVNPITIASRLVAGLVDESGRVTVPGFYHRVRDLSDRGRDVLAAVKFDEAAWRDVAGARATTGEAGFNALERLVARPSADVVSFVSGNRSVAAKSVVPGSATMTLAFGLVPDQQPDEILVALRSWIEARLPRAIESTVTVREATRPTVGPIGRPAFAALVAATKRVHRSEPVLSRHGGVGPPDAVHDAFPEQPVLLVPVGDPSSRLSAPDEQLSRAHLSAAVHLFAELWAELERLGSPP